MSKYEALTEELIDQDDLTVVLTFDQIDAIVGGLPPSARTYSEWWSNRESSQSHSACWLRAGRLAEPDFEKGATVFRLDREAAATRLGPYRPQSENGIDLPFNRIWWVNQGKTYRVERDGSYIWAPEKTKAGTSMRFHTDVEKTRPGDVLLHYSGGAILALGAVSSSAEQATRPADLPTEEWGDEGFLGHVRYFELDEPIRLVEIAEQERLGETSGPFQRDGAVKQGYLFPLSTEFSDYIRDEFAHRWPVESPWAVDAGSTGLHVLLKWAPDLETDTIDEHRTIAESNGWTWWGRWGTARTADSKVDAINGQIEAGVPTYAYLRGGKQVWRARILEMQKDAAAVDTALLPSYYQPSDCSLFMRLTGFGQLTGDWLETNLVLDSDTKNLEGVKNALRGQSATLWVRHAAVPPMTILKVAPGRGAEFWDECVEEGIITVGWSEIGDLRQYATKEELAADYELAFEGRYASAISREVSELWAFRSLNPGDIIIANKGKSEVLGIGTVSAPGYVWAGDREGWKHVVGVDWDTSLSGPISTQGSWRFTIRPVTDEEYRQIVRELRGDVTVVPVATSTMDWLVEHTLWTETALEELIDVLRSESPQVVLAGPPGTGKTWVARHVARHLVDDDESRHRTVQFHPSFGYEEFIEGLRPVSDDGGITFKEVPGVVLQMSEDMGEGDTKVLIIDEMNRANLPRVFGELMYLFEYRNEKISLQYTEDFSLPKGLRFIGTMNTADRSIRSIDIALRRRFDVFECPPDPDILERFYAKDENTNEVEGLIKGMEDLNAKLSGGLDRHHTIGQTFFMQPMMTPKRLRAVWKRKLKPLIEEYFFDEPDVWKGYQLVEFWPSVGAD